MAPALILALLVGVVLAVGIKPVDSQTEGTIYIMPDGGIEPASAPLERFGEVYMFTADVVDTPIVIQRDNIVVDGGGFALTENPAQTDTAIRIMDRTNVTLKNLSIANWGVGVEVTNCANVVLENNIISHKKWGLWIVNSSDVRIEGNTIEALLPIERQTVGILIMDENPSRGGRSMNYTFSRNVVSGEWIGLWGNLDHSVFSWNNLSRCEAGLVIGSYNEIFANNFLDMVKYLGSKAGVVEHRGIGIGVGSNNTLYGNNFTGNGLGLGLHSDNILYGNNFSTTLITWNNPIQHQEHQTFGITAPLAISGVTTLPGILTQKKPTAQEQATRHT